MNRLLKIITPIMVSGIIALSNFSTGVTYAQEFDISEITANKELPSPNQGEINAIIIRLGYKDYPIDKSNKYYNVLTDERLHELFEGDGNSEEQTSYFSGLSDYLKKSSYGKMSMHIGEIIDIQLDENVLSYYTDDYRDVHDILDNNEFIKKFYTSIDVKKYDMDNSGSADAVYIFDVAGDIDWTGGKSNAYASVISLNDYSQRCAYFRPGQETLDLFEPQKGGIWIKSGTDIRQALIHETGHLLLHLKDYYLLPDYYIYNYNDIGNIMGLLGEGDYDAVSKWNMGWLTDDNVIALKPDDNETGVIELTPYDSDTQEGKKIAFFRCGVYFIAVDYCGGINNNELGYAPVLRQNGFRFYMLEPIGGTLEPYKVLSSETQDGMHELFIENEDLYDIFGKGLSITNIQTGANPSFTYTYTHKESNGMSLTYNVTLVDEEGNDLTDKADYKFYVVESDFRISGEKGEKNNIYKVLYGTEIDEITTNLTVKSEGYSAPWLQLKAKKGENGVFAVSPDLISSRQVTVSETDVPGTYNVQIVCEKNTPSAIDEAVLPPFSSISYKVSVLDDTGNDVTDDVEIIFDDITDTDSYINHYVGADSHMLNLGFSYDLPQVDTKINLSSVPDGYISSDIVVNMVKNSDNSGHTVTSPNGNVEVTKDVDTGIYEIMITLQKEQQEETAQQSDGATQSSGDNTQGTEEITEPSDDGTQPEQEITEPSDDETQPTEEIKEPSDNEKTGSADEQPTISEEIKNNDNAKESSSSEESVKKPTETVSKSNSGNDTKVSVITPKAEGKESKNSVTDSVEKNPETGDRSNTPLRITIAGASAGVLATAVIARKRKQS